MSDHEYVAAVVVSTRDRADRLPRLVDALAAQRDVSGRFEVVIVDDGSTDRTPEVLAELASAHRVALQVRRHERSRGPAAGRNTGWRATDAPVIAFTDDDCVPQPGWLASGLQAMGEGRHIVVGRTAPDPDQLVHDGPFARTVSNEGIRFYETCNIFYRRDDLARVDGFDERFTRPGGEDIDLAFRVLAHGVEAIFEPDAEVLHDVRPSRFVLAAREALRWTGVPLFFRKHPEARPLYLKHGVFWKRSHERVLLAALGVALAPRTPVALALTLPWLRSQLGRRSPDEDRIDRVRAIPGNLAVDLLEVVTMLRGSLTHRTLVI